MDLQDIILKKVSVHNLKNISLTIKPRQFVVLTGVSGSGKSSLAFDTIYAEGQRRYIESLSSYARRHMEELPKPDAEKITGLSPTIAIEQKTVAKNPRSTVGTLTGIHDFLRVAFARIATVYCPVSGERVEPQSTQKILQDAFNGFLGKRVYVLAPYARSKKSEFKEDFEELIRLGFTRIRLDGTIMEIAEVSSVDGKKSHDVDLIMDRLQLNAQDKERFLEALTAGLEKGLGMVIIMDADSHEERLFSTHGFSQKSGISYGPLEPSDFSFNHPEGMCPNCSGLGKSYDFNLEAIIDPSLSIAEDCCRIASSYKTVRFGNIYDNLARIYDFSIETPWKKLSEEAKKAFLYGTEKKWTSMHFLHPVKRTSWSEFVQWKGVLHEAKERFTAAKSEVYRKNMLEWMSEGVCRSCNGSRIKPYPSAARIGNKTIAEVNDFSLQEALCFFSALELNPEQSLIAKELVKEVIFRLHYLCDVGLYYLSLSRTSPTLSGGEAQRVRLAAQLGSGLVGVTYILDEPSIGLHPRDNGKLIHSLKGLRDQGNTVLVVEHDEETIAAADEVIDIGPLAGSLGGEVLYQGDYQGLLQCERSLTGAYLSGKKQLFFPKQKKLSKERLILEGVTHHNLKNVTVKIPVGALVAIAGISGSGKSSLISEVLYPAISNKLMKSDLVVGAHKKISGLELFDKIIAIDQAAIGKTPRSNPATYIKAFDEIRDLFAELPESKAQGYKPGRFSFNVKEGSCPHCSGMGMIKIDMDFLEEEWVECSFCKGHRFDSKTLTVHFKGKSIHDVLGMTTKEALELFSAIPKIATKLQTLLDVGLDYIRLGQPSPTLSGGEAQRIKLGKELSRPSTGKTLYILDEPTTGLHFHDIHKLLEVLRKLVSAGNTVIVIEHNMDLVKNADWVIELGPEAGCFGGEVIAEGIPEKIAKTQTPTGVALHDVFFPKERKPSETPQSVLEPIHSIRVVKASQNNLKEVSAEIPRGKITVCTGPSGSGKTSFAFDTLYAEGQRRYTESLSHYARQFVKQMPKPNFEQIEGLSPAIAIEQKAHAGNPRSTVGTITEIYDYLRILYAHLGEAFCPETGEKIVAISKDYVVEALLSLKEGTKVQILAPITLKPFEEFDTVKDRLQKQGYLRIRLNNIYYELDEEIPFDKRMKNTLFLVVDRVVIHPDHSKRIFEAVDQAVSYQTVGFGEGQLTAATPDKDIFFNLAFAAPTSGKSYPPITPHSFSFNTEHGMCLECSGLGIQYGADLISDKDTLEKMYPIFLIEKLWKEAVSKKTLRLLELIATQENSDLYASLEAEEALWFWQGSSEKVPLNTKGSFIRWKGVNKTLAKIATSATGATKADFIPLMKESPCASCLGSRLNPLAQHVRIQGVSIADFCQMPIDKSHSFLQNIKLPKDKQELLKETYLEILHRLSLLKEIGLSYLSLARSAPTLSGGESQRVRLSRQLGSSLSGCLYVLDEPTIGLHPENNRLLNEALLKIKELGNTLVLVEHDPMTIKLADYILDFGPKAGIHGGKIMARGTYQEILDNPDSLTGAYLSGRKRLPIPKTRRLGKGVLQISNACLHNLKGINVSIPLGTLCCVSGVSGSGKSSLIKGILYPACKEGMHHRFDGDIWESPFGQVKGFKHFDKLIVLNQDPIGQTNRADISTYTDLLSALRLFFASLKEAKIRGLQGKHFSYNHKRGMCRTCFGIGTKTIHLQFMPGVKVLCEACSGHRLNPQSLLVKYKDKHLGQLLQMSVEEARVWLPPIPKAVRILDTLIAVGLSYLKLGQDVQTLSGGEAQRLRLSRELAKRGGFKKTLYLFDEPTVGLHPEDIGRLLPIFHALVDKGNSVIIVEHNLDVLASADYIFDIGEGAGDLGGNLVAHGTPEEIIQNPKSITGKYLKELLT